MPADHVVITGGTRGIGLSCAWLLVQRGQAVTVLGRDPARGQEAVERLGSLASYAACDVRDPDGVARVFGQIGTLAGLVCCAGVGGRKGGDGPAHLCTLDAWRNTLDTNLTGAFHAMRSALPHMTTSGGAIVVVSSLAALRGTDQSYGAHAYSASKAGLIGLTRAVAAQYSICGIRANVVAPGPVEPGVRPEKQVGPQGGWASDIAGAVAFLLGPDAQHINGAVLPVDGGLHCRFDLRDGAYGFGKAMSVGP
jgi:NAD(P)-dependent dehydrogenase (short-subunit alcohol dehydrogenase family)